jgi:hypothetical protein
MAMRTQFDLFVLVCQLILALHAAGATTDDSWGNLRLVTRERYYTVMDRKSNCVTGQIVTANDRAVTLKLPDATNATLERADVLRVSVSQAAPNFPHNLRADIARVRDLIYNDKSSWFDIKGLDVQEKIGVAGQEVRIVKKDGHKYEGRVFRISDTQLELDRPVGRLEVSKADVAQVYYLRYKPLTDSEKYSAQEDFWVDPRLWPYYLKLSPKMPVRLYDSSRPEDDTPSRCENDPEEKSAPLESCFAGNVESIDLPNITILQPNNQTKTLHWSKETSVWRRGEQIGIDKIKMGDHILSCGSVKNASFVTKRITVLE